MLLLLVLIRFCILFLPVTCRLYCLCQTHTWIQLLGLVTLSKKDIALIESMQKKFSCVICVWCNISLASYADRCRKLNFRSLKYRWVVADFILTYKIYHNLTNLAFSDFFVYRSSVYSLRQHNWTIQSIRSTTTLPSSQLLQHKHFFINRIPAMWNKLLEMVVSAPSVDVFKKRLSSFDLYKITTLMYILIFAELVLLRVYYFPHL